MPFRYQFVLGVEFFSNVLEIMREALQFGSGVLVFNQLPVLHGIDRHDDIDNRSGYDDVVGHERHEECCPEEHDGGVFQKGRCPDEMLHALSTLRVSLM